MKYKLSKEDIEKLKAKKKELGKGQSKYNDKLKSVSDGKHILK